MKPAILSQKLATAFKGGIQLLIVSSPGIGKSAIVEQAVNNAALVTMHPAVSDPTDFKGMPAVIKATGKSSQSFAEFLPFGNLRKLVEATELTVCFIDDIGQAPHAVQAALMQLIHAREVDGTKISDKVVFVGATNDSSHMAGVASILEPVKSRWNSIIHLEADAKGWRAWALGAGIAPEVIAFIAFRPELLNNFKATRELTNCPSPRTVESLSKLIQAGLDDHELIAGAVGEGFAIEFNAFRKVWKSIPDLDAILAAPLTAPQRRPLTHRRPRLRPLLQGHQSEPPILHGIPRSLAQGIRIPRPLRRHRPRSQATLHQVLHRLDTSQPSHVRLAAPTSHFLTTKNICPISTK